MIVVVDTAKNKFKKNLAIKFYKKTETKKSKLTKAAIISDIDNVLSFHNKISNNLKLLPKIISSNNPG